MQVTAREGARGIAAHASEARAHAGPVGTTRGEALRLDSPRPARWPAWRPADGVQDESAAQPPGGARDLGPARGVLTAVGVGLMFWVAALGSIHLLTG